MPARELNFESLSRLSAGYPRNPPPQCTEAVFSAFPHRRSEGVGVEGGWRHRPHALHPYENDIGIATSCASLEVTSPGVHLKYQPEYLLHLFLKEKFVMITRFIFAKEYTATLDVENNYKYRLN